MIFNSNSKIYLIACSNQLSLEYKPKFYKIVKILKDLNLDVTISSNIFKSDNLLSNGKVRADDLNSAFKNKEITHIFDVSGGVLCNEILPYIDFEIIKNSKALYFGYSDLSVLLNSIYRKTSKKSFYYNIKTILTYNGLENFKNTFLTGSYDMFSLWNYKWLLGSNIRGTLLGGNIRCTLKLAGTEYIPNFKNGKENILFLESNSGDINKIRSFLAQYEMLGIFSNISGLILGEFTEINSKVQNKELEEICINICKKYNISLIKTCEIGHNPESKGIVIGGYYDIKNKLG